MHDLVISPNASLPLPQPRVDVVIRPGTSDDIAFMDSLQRATTKQVGFMPRAQFEGKVKARHVLVAESNGNRVGYLIGNDQYFKRDDVGVIYQINVIPELRRSLVAASLLKAQFERSAYGCKLYCCWCAQDIEANRFWEATGFVPLAFRAGSEKKSRVHIFWQKRIREGDDTTPWWFPSKTNSGSIREDRIVLPIPPGTHWADEMPLVLPAVPNLIHHEDTKGAKREKSDSFVSPSPPSRLRGEKTPPPVRRNGLLFDIPKQGEPLPELAPAKPVKAKPEPKPKAKFAPQAISAARELRDRWMEQVNANPQLVGGSGKYRVVRAIDAAPAAVPRLAA